MILEKINLINGETSNFGVKCSKRGNSVYARRVETRFTNFCRQIPNTIFFEPHQPVKITRALWVTLTYDTKINTFREAWKTISKDFNRFMSNIRKLYGEVSVVRCYEAFQNGHPHIHAILIFQHQKFEVKARFDAEKGKNYWRIKQDVTIETYWHSRVDIQAMPSLSEGIKYIRKYLTKSINAYAKNSEGDKHLKTLALTWLYSKRSFSISGTFLRKLFVLTQELHNSNRIQKQISLTGGILVDFVYSVLGFVPSYIIDLESSPKNPFSLQLNPLQLRNAEKYLSQKWE